MKKVILAGATGMIGGLILEQCLNAVEVSTVVSLVRKTTGQKHPKLKEIIVSDFKDYSSLQSELKNADLAFFCIGVYTGQVEDDLLKAITVDYAVAFATALKEYAPQVRFCFLSGQGADRSGKSRMSFARYKGMAENQIAALELGAFHAFRPGYIYPVQPREEPNTMYKISRMLYPVIRLFGKNASVKSTELATAMFEVGMKGYPEEVLENKDIAALVTA